MTKTSIAAAQTIGLVTVGGSLAGAVYVVARYLLDPYSELGRMFVGLYSLGGVVVGIVPGVLTGVLFLGLLFGARKVTALRDRRMGAPLLAAALAGTVSAAITCVGLVALNEHLNPLLFVVGFGLAATGYLLLEHRIVERWYQRSIADPDSVPTVQGRSHASGSPDL